MNVRRRLRNIIVVTLMLTAIFAGVAWIRCYRRVDLLESGAYDGTRYDNWYFACARGRIQLEHRVIYGDGDQPPALAYASLMPSQWDDDLQWLEWHPQTTTDSRSTFCVAGVGLECQISNPLDPQDYRPIAISFPYWLIMLVTAGIAWRLLSTTPNQCPEREGFAVVQD